MNLDDLERHLVQAHGFPAMGGVDQAEEHDLDHRGLCGLPRSRPLVPHEHEEDADGK
jgi:hypothetical protein